MISDDDADPMDDPPAAKPTSITTPPLPSAGASSTPRAGTSTPSPPSPSAARRPYVRQFQTGYTGTLEVWIRSKSNLKLPNITVQCFLNDRCKSIASIMPHRDKLVVTFGDRVEANAFVRGPGLEGIGVTIPNKCVVDVEGAVRADDLDGLESLDALKSVGKGVFGDAGLPTCRILYAERVPGVDSAGQRTISNTIKVFFEGDLMPKYISIHNLRIPVRLFHKSPMLCTTCQTLGHTSKFCKRKPKCARCGSNHLTTECSNPAVNKLLCPHCARSHPDSRALCPYFQQVAKDFKAKQILSSRQRYQRTVAARGEPNGATQRPQLQAPELNTVNFPPLRNAYAALAADQPEEPTDRAAEVQLVHLPFPPPPKNPYASSPRGRSRKRRRDGSLSVTRLPARQQHPTPQQRPSAAHQRQPANLQRQPAAHQRQPQRTASDARNATAQREQQAAKLKNATLRLVIIQLARSLGLSETWMVILEAVIDPLLAALLPNSDAIVAAVTPHLSSLLR